MSEELKPCPFCGWEAEETNNEGFPAMRCSNPDCFAGVEWVNHIKREFLREYWNTRAELITPQNKAFCVHCGAALMYAISVDGGIHVIDNFCSNCGAKVVD